MTESMICLRVSKINGVPLPAQKSTRHLRVFVRPGDRHYSKCACSGEQTLECTKIFKIFFNAIGKQSITIKLTENGPTEVEIASLSIPLTWIPREYYVAESFPLRPLIPGIATPIAFVEIQLSSNPNILPFTLPPADLIHIPAWRPYPKVALPINTAAESKQSQGNLNSNQNQNLNSNRVVNDYTPSQASMNIPLKRKRSSSLCVENVSKLNQLISENTSSGSDDYTDETTDTEPSVEYKLYMAFVPPIMKNGMEPARLEPKKYRDNELSDILSKHAYSGALLNGQYINPPKFFTKNIPLCEKVNGEKNQNKSSSNSNKNIPNKPTKPSNNITTPESSHRRKHHHRHIHENNNNVDNKSYRSRSIIKSPNSSIPGSFFAQDKDSKKIDQRSNSSQINKGFFQKGMMQKFIDMKKSLRAPPPEYQELNNDVLFKDEM